ncbi:MAG: flagellar hook-associated protein FlgK [Erythrobacter sp.]
MPTSLISIGRSGAAAARASLELTAQNIANASNPDYVRRTTSQSEFVASATIDFQSRTSFSGTRAGDVQRANSELIQRQARDSGSDLSRAQAELSGLRDAETALENSRIFEGLVDFEAALTLLESDPSDSALRTGALETAWQLTSTFQFADTALGNARALVEDDLSIGAESVNGAAEELTRINLALVNSREGTAGRASLLDARDASLRDLADEFGISVQFDEFGAAEVRIAAAPPAASGSGPILVSGTIANTVTGSVAADGSSTFEIGGVEFTPTSGAMAGRAAALSDLGLRQNELDAAAAAVIDRANTAQAAGAAFDGSPGQPLFSGSSAGDIALALNDGSGLALAPVGSPAGSRDTANLTNLIAAFGADDGPIASTDRSLLALSSRIAGLETTSEGLAIINSSAEAELLSETGVDLDVEAANLIRLQQAFEANSRVIQVANDLFDTILGLR